MWWWLNRWVHDLKRTEKYLHQTTWLWCLQAQACFGWVGVGSTVEVRSWRARWHLWPSLTHTCVLLLASSSGSYCVWGRTGMITDLNLASFYLGAVAPKSLSFESYFFKIGFESKLPYFGSTTNTHFLILCSFKL